MITAYAIAFTVAVVFQVLFWYFEKQRYYRTLGEIQDMHKIQVNRLEKRATEYQEIAESHTITWEGFEPDQYTVLLHRTLVMPGRNLEDTLWLLLRPYENETVRVTYSIGVKGNWAERLSRIHGWKNLEPSKLTYPNYWNDVVIEGDVRTVLNSATGSLHAADFWTPSGKENGPTGNYDLPDNLYFEIKIEKKVPCEHPKPKVEFVEVKVLVPEDLPLIDQYKREEEEKRAERAALIAAELEVDPELQKKILALQKSTLS